jgi:hypothetical protein
MNFSPFLHTGLYFFKCCLAGPPPLSPPHTAVGPAGTNLPQTLAQHVLSAVSLTGFTPISAPVIPTCLTTIIAGTPTSVVGQLEVLQVCAGF